MSYDIDLDAPPHWPLGAVPQFEAWNYTSNCAPMWRAAGVDLAAFDGRTAAECAKPLGEAIAAMEADPERFKAMNPRNGWGSYDSVLDALRELHAGFVRCPGAIVRVCR